ncbi:MAG: triacylglycerol lipase [Ectothiorhodospiraceae bacterium]|nr:triacylglycerol lipase [Ectothiorhodospiraceae bacterium]
MYRNTSLRAVAAALLLLLASQVAHAGYTATRYPIVLVHGLLGFDSIAGAINYWYRIPAELERGGADVYVVKVDPVQSNEVRGEQLAQQVEDILAISGADRVNLIGHSQGGLTARYVAATRPQLVASVTSVGTPNQGSTVADVIRAGLREGGISESVVSSIANGFGNLINVLSGGGWSGADSVAALDSLTTAGLEDFNSRYHGAAVPSGCGNAAHMVDGVRYFSWGGTSVLTNVLDPSDAALGLTSLAFVFDERNDGLVGRCSSRLGYVIRDDYRMNHLDLVNQTFGLVSPFEVKPTTLYRQHANRLQQAGF